MADGTVVHIGENSPEYVAYKLLHDIMSAEGRTFNASSSKQIVDRTYILKTYYQCWQVAKGVEPDL